MALVKLLGAAAAAAAGGMAWGHFEAGWLRTRTLGCPLPGLPAELVGLRIAHLSDFHLGRPSRGERAVEQAVEWVAGRRPDLVCVTGDLLSHPRGAQGLRSLLDRLPCVYAVLGNHDLGIARDPRARATEAADLGAATLLSNTAVTLELRGLRVQIVGVEPRSYLRRHAHPESLVDRAAALHILLCHFPRIVDRLPLDAFDLVLAGHLHDGQIAVPYGRGKLRLAHPSYPYPSGPYRRPAAVLHVSPGLGTTFVPFRFCARPEVTELVLQSTEV